MLSGDHQRSIEGQLFDLDLDALGMISEFTDVKKLGDINQIVFKH